MVNLNRKDISLVITTSDREILLDKLTGVRDLLAKHLDESIKQELPNSIDLLNELDAVNYILTFFE